MFLSTVFTRIQLIFLHLSKSCLVIQKHDFYGAEKLVSMASSILCINQRMNIIQY